MMCNTSCGGKHLLCLRDGLLCSLLFVPPMRSNTVLSNEVHLVSSDLDFYRLLIWQLDYCVDGLVAIWLWVANVVLESSIYFGPDSVDLRKE